MRRHVLLVLAVFVAGTGPCAWADDDPSAPLAANGGGARVLQGGLQEAAVWRAQVCVAVLDVAGHTMASQCTDGVAPGSSDGALAKARHSVHFRTPTKDFETALNLGATELLAVPGLVPVEGGEPITLNGTFVGAVGVSGAAPDIDGRIARAAAAALAKDH